jgi:GDPmannose 4,6-dehydratase
MIASAAARISRGSSELLEIGNLDVVKEWAFARDIVEGIWALINQDEIFEAAIGSGKGYSIRTWAAECFSKVGLDALEYIRPRSSYVADFDRLVSDPMTMNGIGWKATTSMSTLASMMLDAELAAL